MGVQPLSIESVGFQLTRVGKQTFIWRAIGAGERVLSALLLLLFLPLIVCAAVAVAILSRRAPLIAHLRVGRQGHPIWVLKLRTMWKADAGGAWTISLVERLRTESPEIALKTARDPRVTSRFAAICRKYSIDELPQLWHVVQGQMGLVGPRPLTVSEIQKHYGGAAACLLSVKPGISGLWQTKGRSRLTYNQRRRLDLFMIRKWSVGLYFRILGATVPSVLGGKNAW